MYKPLNKQQMDAMVWALQTNEGSPAIIRFQVLASVCVSNIIEGLPAGKAWEEQKGAEMRDLLATIVKEYEEYQNK